MNWKALLKIIGVAAGATGVTEAAKTTSASGYEIAAQVLTILGMVGAYMLKAPIEKKSADK